jgi:hypothetical protein
MPVAENRGGAAVHFDRGNMKSLIAASLIIVGAIHLLPVTGVLGSAQLARLYGIAVEEPNMLILMRHRAVLFAMLGAFLVYSAFVPALHTLAFIAAFISVSSFLWLSWSIGQNNAQIARVVSVDIVALLMLAAGAAMSWWQNASR